MSTQLEAQKTLTKELAVKYLNIYVGEAEWGRALDDLWGKIVKKHPDEEEAKALFRKTIACTVLLPSYDKTKIPEVPTNLLFWCQSYTQFNEREWSSLLDEVIAQDTAIEGYRSKCQMLGVIHPLVYAPWPRQAYNWLFKAAEDSHVVTENNKSQIEKRFERLVLTYGGAVVCALFQKEEGKIKRKVLNWRTGYFFERLIFEVYTIDQVIKIKQQELKKTNPQLVKKIQN